MSHEFNSTRKSPIVSHKPRNENQLGAPRCSEGSFNPLSIDVIAGPGEYVAPDGSGVLPCPVGMSCPGGPGFLLPQPCPPGQYQLSSGAPWRHQREVEDESHTTCILYYYIILYQHILIYIYIYIYMYMHISTLYICTYDVCAAVVCLFSFYFGTAFHFQTICAPGCINLCEVN